MESNYFRYIGFFLCLVITSTLDLVAQPINIENLEVVWLETTSQVKASFLVEDTDSETVLVRFFAGDEACTLDELTADTDMFTTGQAHEVLFDIPRPDLFKMTVENMEAPNIQNLVDQVSIDSLYNNLSLIVGIRHFNTGLEHLEAVKALIQNRFEMACLDTYRQDMDSLSADYLSQNIVGRKVGMGSTDTTIIIDGHFDTVNMSPGADDNGSAVAGVLEAVRILSQYDFKYSLDFIGFDLEEAGLLGSNYYVQNRNMEETILGVLNFEMIGYYDDNPNTQELPLGFSLLFPEATELLEANEFRGDFITNVGNENSILLMDLYENSAAQYVPSLKVISLAVPGNGTIAQDLRRSDHARFWDAGIPALMLTDGANFRNYNYHSPNDTLGTINFEFMVDVVKAAIATAATMAEIQAVTVQETVSVTDWVDTGINEPTQYYMQVNQNPTQHLLNIRLNQMPQKTLQFKLYDLSGKLVKEVASNEQQLQMDVAEFPTGVYILKMFNGRFQQSHKLVIE